MKFQTRFIAGLLAVMWLALICIVGCTASGPSSVPQKSTRPGSNPPDSPERPTMDPKSVVFSLRGDEEAFRKCFMRAIGSRGAVATRFLVDEQGAVESVEVTRSTLSQAGVQECLTQRLMEHRFGAQPAPSRGSWTFVFRLTDPLSKTKRTALLAQARRDPRAAAFVTDGSAGQVDVAKVDEIVQARYPLYAHCYRDSIGRTEEAGGVLRLRFSIERSGGVSNVQDAGSVLPDPFAVDCMAEAFYAMVFPSPSGGAATVEYRLDLE